MRESSVKKVKPRKKLVFIVRERIIKTTGEKIIFYKDGHKVHFDKKGRRLYTTDRWGHIIC